MINGFIETIIGLVLFDSSVKGLRKSVIRKWREGFVLSLIAGVFAVIHGLVWTILSLPDFFNIVMLTVIFFIVTLAFYNISRMKGLKA